MNEQSGTQASVEINDNVSVSTGNEQVGASADAS